MISTIALETTVSKVLPTNHVFVVDVSYSMCSSLPKIREHLKHAMRSVIKPLDTLSVVYFSSKGCYGSVFTGKEVASFSPSSLKDLDDAIDAKIIPIGCTGFVEPLDLSSQIATTLQTLNGNENSLIFMTDGYDNCWTKDQILASCQSLPNHFSDIVFLEYGWYCNRELLAEMSDAVKGQHTFKENFDAFSIELDTLLSNEKVPRTEVPCDNSVATLYVHNNKVKYSRTTQPTMLVPNNVSELYLISQESIDGISGVDNADQLLVMFYHALDTFNHDLAIAALKVLGDVRLFTAYNNCFTKQDYSKVKDLVELCIVDVSERFVDGVDYNMVPDDGATTIINVLDALIANGAMLDIKSPSFKYNRTTKARVQREDSVIDDLSAQIAESTDSSERKLLAMQLAAHEEWTPVFVSNCTYIPMNKLVYNSNRPNISINTMQTGTIDLPTSKVCVYNLPKSINTMIYRNYTIVRDGIVNLKVLPVVIEKSNLHNITDVKYDVTGDVDISGVQYHTVNVHLDSVPLINRDMVKTASGADFLKNHAWLQVLKAKQKVLKYYRDELNDVGASSKGMAQLYGEEAAQWLSSVGIRDYGFSPPTDAVKSGDFYISKELNVKIKGLSSLPSISAVCKKIDAGKKLTISDELISDALSEYANMGMGTDMYRKWIDTNTSLIIDQVRLIESKLAMSACSVILAKSWFYDLDQEQDTHTVTYGGRDYTINLVLEQNQVNI